VESAKEAAKFTLGDATLLLIDGEEEGMTMAKDLLARPDTNVNLQMEMDDGSKGTPLACAILSMAQPKAENSMALVRALLEHKDVDVNAVLKTKDYTKVTPLVVAMKAVAAGLPFGVEIAKALLAHDQIAVNAVTEGPTKLAALHMALAAAARGSAAGLDLAGVLLARSDTDPDIKMVGHDGAVTTPLSKLASMLQEKPSDANVQKAIRLLVGRATPLEDPTLQRLVDQAVASKEEL